MEDRKEQREARKQWFAQMEQKLQEAYPKEEDRMFYCHSSEDRIVLSHALYWTMTQLQFFKGKIRKEIFFLLLRQYEEEMLDAFLQEDDNFLELQHYCNILYEMLLIILGASHLKANKDAWKLAAIAVVAAGYGGDMDEELTVSGDRFLTRVPDTGSGYMPTGADSLPCSLNDSSVYAS